MRAAGGWGIRGWSDSNRGVCPWCDTVWAWPGMLFLGGRSPPKPGSGLVAGVLILDVPELLVWVQFWGTNETSQPEWSQADGGLRSRHRGFASSDHHQPSATVVMLDDVPGSRMFSHVWPCCLREHGAACKSASYGMAVSTDPSLGWWAFHGAV